MRRLPFTLDPEVIHHIIHSQAGSIGKAIIELVMNSVDAQASVLALTVDAQGFKAVDDGQGFASEEDVIRYFGRFGTPHQEGDATFGRFRLGRGQIMAHAITEWKSNRWFMGVDTRTMGYAYDFDELETPEPGCAIEGRWYEPLGPMELYEVLQELRDLIRYTPLTVSLNDKVITRDPKLESWDHEDDLAYYRFRKEGSVAIYNQGVLVRHDPGQTWGAGGLVVTKKAIGLNVSRTEILRKTCPIWQGIAKKARDLAKVYANDSSQRQGENARAHAARLIKVAQGDELLQLLSKEQVITQLPGTRHLSVLAFIRQSSSLVTIAPTWGGQMPLAENLAAARVALVLHPRTLERFECADSAEFEELWADILGRVETGVQTHWGRSFASMMRHKQFVSFSSVKANFTLKTEVVADEALPAELRRSWKALRWALTHYAAVVANERNVSRNHTGTTWLADRKFTILLGKSTSASAWTDGQSYIAFDIKEVEKIGGEGLRAAQRLFALLDHELAHQGDSLDATHDESFYARFHDISLDYAVDKQFYLQRWVAKYCLASTRGKRPGWARRATALHETIAKGEGQGSSFEAPLDHDEEPSPSPMMLATVNAGLGVIGGQSLDVDAVVDQSRQERERGENPDLDPEPDASCSDELEADPEWDAHYEEMQREWQEELRQLNLAEEQEQAALISAAREEVEARLERSIAPEEAQRLVDSDLVEFIRMQGRFPEREPGWRPHEPMRESELWIWKDQGRPLLRPEQNLLALQRLARGQGRRLSEYLADIPKEV